MLFLDLEIVTTFYSCYAKPGLFTSFEFCALTSIIRLSVLWETERGKKPSYRQVSAGYSIIQLKTSHLFPSFTVKKRHLWNQLQTKGQRNTHTHTQKKTTKICFQSNVCHTLSQVSTDCFRSTEVSITFDIRRDCFFSCYTYAAFFITILRCLNMDIVRRV